MMHSNPQHITPSDGDRARWTTLATALYQANRPRLGHRFRMAAAMPGPIPLKEYDDLMTIYRAWLLSNYLPADR